MIGNFKKGGGGGEDGGGKFEGESGKNRRDLEAVKSLSWENPTNTNLHDFLNHSRQNRIPSDVANNAILKATNNGSISDANSAENRAANSAANRADINTAGNAAYNAKMSAASDAANKAEKSGGVNFAETERNAGRNPSGKSFAGNAASWGHDANFNGFLHDAVRRGFSNAAEMKFSVPEDAADAVKNKEFHRNTSHKRLSDAASTVGLPVATDSKKNSGARPRSSGDAEKEKSGAIPGPSGADGGGISSAAFKGLFGPKKENVKKMSIGRLAV